MVGYKHLPTGVQCQVRKFLPILWGHNTGSIFTALSKYRFFCRYSIILSSFLHLDGLGWFMVQDFNEKCHWVIKHSNVWPPSYKLVYKPH